MAVVGVVAVAQESRPASTPTNLLPNGDFETLDDAGRLPVHWATEHPGNVRVVRDPQRGSVIEMTGDKKLMASYGVDLLSDAEIPVKPNTRYRCTGFTRSTGPHMKVFIRGYATVTRRVNGELKTFDDAVYTMRKDIDPTAAWTPFNLDFDVTPAAVFSDFQHTIKYVRVKLWAFWPVGTCWFDDIRFEEVGPLPADKIRRPDAVTHTGEPPRLGPGAHEPEAFDEEQAWVDAANAFRAGELARALPPAEQLVARAPQKGTYRILLARTLAGLTRWSEADEAAAWFLSEATSRPAMETEPWQRDWALIIHAQACHQAGRSNEARRTAEQVLRPDASPQARQAAEELLKQLDSPPQ